MLNPCCHIAIWAWMGLFPVIAIAAAPPPESRLSFLAEEVQVIHAGTAEKGTAGQTVSEGDSVKTGPQSLCIVTLKDGSQLKLGANSQITIQKPSEIILNSGETFAKVEKQKLPHFLLRTKVATMGVRGTEFFAAMGRKSARGEDLWLCVNEGVVDVTSTADGKPVTVKQGLGVLVPAGKGATPPKAYPWTKNLNWNMNPKSGDVTNPSSIDSAYQDLRDQNYD